MRRRGAANFAGAPAGDGRGGARDELRGVRRRKFGLPAKAVTEIESILRGYHVQPIAS